MTGNSLGRGAFYGRRKFIPIAVVTAIVSLVNAARARSGVAVGFNASMLIWCASICYRHWKNPMPARLAARFQRIGISGDEAFGTKRWHEAAVGLIVVLGSGFVLLISFASVQGAHARR